MAALVYIRKVTTTTSVSQVTPEYVEQGRAHILQDKIIPPYVAVLRIHGPFLFGATEKLDEISGKISELPPVIVLRLRNMTAIDATGLQALEHFADAVHESSRGLILCGAPSQPAELMKQAEFEQHVGSQNICANVGEALERAKIVYQEALLTAPSSER
jgi:sulfate permease, SulP family